MANRAKARSGLPVKLGNDMFPLPSAKTHEAELLADTGVLGSGDCPSMFLLTSSRDKGTGISFRVRHEHRVFHKHAKGARV